MINVKNHARRRLKFIFLAFFFSLAIPSVVLIQQANKQLKWEAFHQYRQLAEELATRINSNFNLLIESEENRSFTDYQFLVVKGDADNSFLQPSPLSTYPLKKSIPGLLGYFQVNAQGHFSTPLLPNNTANVYNYGISTQQLLDRKQLKQKIQTILVENQLVKKHSISPSSIKDIAAPKVAEANEVEYESKTSLPLEKSLSPVLSQKAFDNLKEGSKNLQSQSRTLSQNQRYGNLGRVDDLKLDPAFELEQRSRSKSSSKKKAQVSPQKRSARKEIVALAESIAPIQNDEEDQSNVLVNINLFESKVAPFEFSLMNSGHFVMYRKVWRDGQRYIQGAVIDQAIFLQAIETLFRETTLSQVSNLTIAYQGNVLSVLGGELQKQYLSNTDNLTGSLLYQTQLYEPFKELSLIFSLTHVPLGQGGKIIFWSGIVLAIVLLCGTFLMYRLGRKQIALAEQQQDFVSAVSHELKTPLTSIRMYGEILKEGWAPDEKKKQYYNFIYDESERLSRLIANVLQLANMSRNEFNANMQRVSVHELIDLIRSKIDSQVTSANITLNLIIDDAIKDTTIKVDRDFFSQIIINLVDNAIKFSTKSTTKKIDIAAKLHTANTIVFTVRDYGPGIAKNQMKKIFDLFYRMENELTRETVGTGIGLALVNQLALSMDGKVDVINQDPGAEFRIYFNK